MLPALLLASVATAVTSPADVHVAPNLRDLGSRPRGRVVALAICLAVAFAYASSASAWTPDDGLWSVLKPIASPRVLEAQGFWDGPRDRFLTFGGEFGVFSSEVWEAPREGERWAKVQAEGIPPPRPPRDYRIVRDSRRDRMLVLGDLRTIWALDLSGPATW